MFDPSSFLDAVHTEANSTTAIPVPAGEYPAALRDLKPVPWQSKDGSKAGLKLEISWDLQLTPEAETELGRPSAISRQTIMLDVSESGGLDFGRGRNVGLGKLREALGMNAPGVPFSLSQLVGKSAIVKVTHSTYTAGNGEQKLRAEVTEVAKF